MYKNYDSGIHPRKMPAYEYRRQCHSYEEAKKAQVLALSVPSTHTLYSLLWQNVIAQTAEPFKMYFLPYINEITHLVFRKTLNVSVQLLRNYCFIL